MLAARASAQLHLVISKLVRFFTLDAWSQALLCRAAGNNGFHRRAQYAKDQQQNHQAGAGLFAGFYAIVAAMGGRFEAAAIAIFAAMIMDGIDGRIARLTRTQSAFDEQYDSLSDMVSFGLSARLSELNAAAAVKNYERVDALVAARNECGVGSRR